MVWRASSMASAVPKWTDAGVCQPMPEWRWTWLYSLKNPSRNSCASPRDAKDFGKSWTYFRVLNWASLKGLSLTCSRPGVGSVDAEVGQQLRDRPRGHRRAAIGVHRVRGRAVAGDGLVDEFLCFLSAFGC